MLTIGRSSLILAFTTVAACATGHSAMNGTVIMKVSETEAHVCLLEGDTRVGTRIQLYRHSCRNQYEKPGTPGTERRPYICEKEPVAVGTIAQKMGGHYALVTFPRGTQYEEGYTVEPIRGMLRTSRSRDEAPDLADPEQPPGPRALTSGSCPGGTWTSG